MKYLRAINNQLLKSKINLATCLGKGMRHPKMVIVFAYFMRRFASNDPSLSLPKSGFWSMAFVKVKTRPYSSRRSS